jgi:recyclin-1
MNIIQVLGGGARSKQSSTLPQKHISTLPPDIIARVFTFLPVPDLPHVSCVSRRWKVIVYGDQVWEGKLISVGMGTLLLSGSGGVQELQGLALKDSLAARLRQLPGGQFLPTRGKFLHLEQTSPVTGTNDTLIVGPLISSPQHESPAENLIGISAALPDSKASHLIIGAGGLKAALKKAEKGVPLTSALEKSKKSTLQRHLDSKSSDTVVKKNVAREFFRKIFVELYPYYIDFVENSNDSLVFRDYSDLSEIGAVLHRLVLFDKSQFLSRDTKEISSNLNSTVEWFESRLLGQFDAAYDRHDVEEMRANAYAAYQLNGGNGCVQAFMSKNPGMMPDYFSSSIF